MAQRHRPQEVIAFCLEPLDLNDRSPAVRETVRRLTDAFQAARGMATTRIPSIDPAKSPVVINETAHGCEM